MTTLLAFAAIIVAFALGVACGRYIRTRSSCKPATDPVREALRRSPSLKA
jgi:hypothetical protein